MMNRRGWFKAMVGATTGAAAVVPVVAKAARVDAAYSMTVNGKPIYTVGQIQVVGSAFPNQNPAIAELLRRANTQVAFHHTQGKISDLVFP